MDDISVRQAAEKVGQACNALPETAVIRRLAEERDQELWLVGGFPRDILLGRRAAADADFVVAGAAAPLAAAFAGQIGGSWFVLDTERDACRVITRDRSLHRQWDFSPLAEGGILADLGRRDLTINAMALGLHPGPALLFDPFHGLDDLAARLVRAVSDEAFLADPLRRLRALRFCAIPGFALDAHTAGLLAGPDLLAAVAGERVREELAALLATPVRADLLALLGSSRMLASLPPSGSFNIRFASALDQILAHHLPPPLGDSSPADFLSTIVAHGMHRVALLRLLALLLPMQPITPQTLATEKHILLAHLARLKPGSRALAFHHRTLDALVSLLGGGGARGAEGWDYFDRHGDGGIGGVLLAAAAGLLPADHPGPAETFDFYLRAYLPAMARPLPLTASEIMESCSLPPGPELGGVIRRLRHEQRLGRVHGRQEALHLLRSLAPLDRRPFRAGGD